MSLTLVTRLTNLGHSSLSHGEAFRASWQGDGDLSRARRFPPLQFVMGWAIVRTLGANEFAFRLPYALAGVALVGMMYGFTRRILDDWSALAVAAVTAAHPILFFYSRQSKVFSLDALAAVAITWVGWEAYRRLDRRALWNFLLVSILALGFTFAAPLLLAAWLPILAWRYMWPTLKDTGLRKAYALMAACALLAGLVWYEWLRGNALQNAMVNYYYARIEPVWPMSYALSDLFTWLLHSVQGAARFMLGIESVWPPLNWCIGTVEILAIGAAIGVLWKRCRPLVYMACLLGIVAILAGALRYWPFGKIRHTTFMIPLVTFAIGVGLCQLMRALGRSIPSALLVALCVLIPAARAVKASVIAPQTFEHIRPVLAEVESRIEPGDAMFVYYAAGHSFEFYWQRSDVPVLIERGIDRDQIALFATRFKHWIRQHDRVWFVFMHNWKEERTEWVAHLKRTYDLVDHVAGADASAHCFQKR